ncbi:helix-turn-helix transcriptional regulator [Robertkochia flava]|uniref:helix-turn-helix transcriptional regulator n=1 Tax=Robertkochia flava TaxID=3447986 RepID=UPI001CCADD06|nr:helix-turn-helix domain-containing protein [Robertkochia marina]
MNRIIHVEEVTKEELLESFEVLLEQKLQEHLKAPETLLSIQEAAKRLGVTQLTVRNYIKKGCLPAVRIGARRIFIKQSDLDKALKEVKSLKYKRDL